MLAIACGFVYSQETMNGFHALKIGTDYTTVKTLLDTKKTMGYYLAQEFAFYKSADPSVKEEEYPKDFYPVLNTEKKYFTYLGVPVTSVEVSFDDNNKLSHIMIIIPKNPKNEKTIQANARKVLGQTDCSHDLDPETQQPVNFFCMWFGEDTEVIICNWNGIGEMTYDKDIMVEIKRL